MWIKVLGVGSLPCRSVSWRGSELYGVELSLKCIPDSLTYAKYLAKNVFQSSVVTQEEEYQLCSFGVVCLFPSYCFLAFHH